MSHPSVRFWPLATACLIAACGSGRTPPPTTGTLNGSRVVSEQAYEFGFTPLSAGTVSETAQLKAVSVGALSAGTATAKVCGSGGLRLQAGTTTAISIDSTGSMSWTDPRENRKAAAKSYVHHMNRNDLGAVLSFDSTTVPSPGMRGSYLWQDFTGVPGQMIAAIEHATFVGGNTPLYDAALDGIDLLVKRGGDHPTLLMVTDGEDNASTHLPADVVALAAEHHIEIYVVGLNDSRTMDFSSAEEIASKTGGLFQEATSSTQLQTYFDNVYNALHAQGCLHLQFTAKPAAGTVVTGKLDVTVSDVGKPDAVVSTPFSLTVR